MLQKYSRASDRVDDRVEHYIVLLKSLLPMLREETLDNNHRLVGDQVVDRTAMADLEYLQKGLKAEQYLLTRGLLQTSRLLLAQLAVILCKGEVVNSRHFSELFFRMYLVMVFILVECADGINILITEQPLTRLVMNALSSHSAVLPDIPVSAFTDTFISNKD